MSRTVRFHAIGGPESIRLDEVEIPRPGSGEVRIRARALGLNRVDVMFRTGNHFAVPSLPQAQGLEAAGVIESIGPGVTGLEVGDIVSVVPAFSLTEYALHGELVLAPARAVVAHPESLSFEEAAALWMAHTTAYGGLIDIADLSRGDDVVISAASSSVGLAAIQIARRVGARPIALSRTAQKRDFLLQAGAVDVVATEEEDVTARLDEITHGSGVDVYFDPVGGSRLPELLAAATDYATVVIYGTLGGATSMPVLALLQHRLTIRGYDVNEITGDDHRLACAITFITEGIQDGALRPRVDRDFPFEQIVDAYAYLEAGAQAGKVVVVLPQVQ